MTFREHAKIFMGAVKLYYLYQFGGAEANYNNKGEHGKWLQGASDILAIFSRCKAVLTPPPPSSKYTHTYNSQSHSHHHRNHHMREPNIRIEQNRSTTYFKNKKLISCHGTRHFAIQTLPSVAYMFFLGWMDGWITCDFTSFSTVFQSYQDDVRLIMKSCVQWNSGDRTRSARSVGQLLTLWVTGAPYFLGKQLCHVHFAFLKETKKVDSVNLYSPPKWLWSV